MLRNTFLLMGKNNLKSNIKRKLKYFSIYIILISILHLAKEFDLLGLDITFLINRNRTYTTYAGLFFTLILLSFLLISFVQMIYDIQNGANPVTQRTSQYLQQNEGFSFPAGSFVFVVYVGDAVSQYIENTKEKTYYTMQFQKVVFGTEYTATTFDFGKCNNKTLDYLLSQGANIKRDQVSCINEEIFMKDGAMTLENAYQHQNISKFSFQIYRCVNDTNADYVCASDEEIDAKLQNALVICSFPLYEFNALNYTHPYQIKIGQRFMTVNNDNYKIMNLVYKQSQSFTEQNAFYFFPSQRLDVGLEYYESYFDLQSGIPNNCLGVIQLYLDGQKFVYHRNYQNIFNVFGALGGTFSVIRTIFMLLLKPIQRLQFATSMFNKISGKQKELKVLDYFKSKQQRKVIQDYYQIIQQAIELESYMEMILKFENNLLTFRSSKLTKSNAGLIQSQRLVKLPQLTDKGDKINSREDDVLNIYQTEQINSAKDQNNVSENYIDFLQLTQFVSFLNCVYQSYRRFNFQSY
ncbi:hypothetical protein pb186bvf_010880 [Paramecium bursaria]